MKKIKKSKELIISSSECSCPECGGQRSFLAGQNASGVVSCVTCSGTGRVQAPKIKIDERSEVCIDGKKLVKGQDYVIDSELGIILKEKVIMKLRDAKSYRISSMYYKNVVKQ
jgi:hypothetical protein